MQIFQKNFRHFLNKLDLSETKLAAEIGVDQRTLSRYYNDGGNPKPDTLLKLAKRFGCSVEDLWTYDFENPNPEHPRQHTRKPSVTNKEFSFFKERKLFVYYLREGTVADVYEGYIQLEKNYDSQRLYLHGHAKTGHDYDVKLIIEGNSSIFIYGISDEGERRFFIALHYPDFREEKVYKNGLGVLTRLDAQKVIVAQRVVLSDKMMNLGDPDVKAHLIRLLSDNDKAPRVWVNARVDHEFRVGKWLED